MKITKIGVTIEITDHASAQLEVQSATPQPTEIPINEVVQRIIKLNSGIIQFWQESGAYAPIEAAKLLSKSRLDWQLSLTYCLKIWLNIPPDESADGHLILAWTNLGSLVEGMMKLFLSVWHKTYLDDENYIAMRTIKGELQDADKLWFEQIRQYFSKVIWDDSWDNWVHHIQLRRNAIHAYRDRDIGTHQEFLEDIQKYLSFLRYINARLPYPDEAYIPREF